jgi:ABC-2 type transport system ATP-binding protein
MIAAELRRPEADAPSSIDANASEAPCVQVTAARYVIGARCVLAGVDLELRSGEIYGLIGPNGAGKTTLIKAICGRLQLLSGSVLIKGRDPRRDQAARREIGFVPQEIAIYPHLTVVENLQVFGRLAGVARSELKETIRNVLTQAGLVERAHQICRTLSGGYQRRVNICASILHRPSALVLDEPTVGIDIEARKSVHAMLSNLRDQGTAILIVTHDLEEAQHLANRIGLLQDGRLVIEGVPEELLHKEFGADKEVLATLTAQPNDNGVAALTKMGFTSLQSLLSWRARMKTEGLDINALTKDFAAAGLLVREIRIREPDLNSLFLQALNRDNQL